jgi:hypothetical protein
VSTTLPAGTFATRVGGAKGSCMIQMNYFLGFLEPSAGGLGGLPLFTELYIEG